MPKPTIPELTQQAIKRARRNGEGSLAQIAQRFKVSESTVKRICKDVSPGDKDALESVIETVAQNRETIAVGGLDLSEYLESMAADLRADLARVEPKSKEGVAGAVLKLLQFYAQLYPPTLEGIVDQLLSHPDFRLDTVANLIRDRYARKAS
jgi:hypothetical protein